MSDTSESKETAVSRVQRALVSLCFAVATGALVAALDVLFARSVPPAPPFLAAVAANLGLVVAPAVLVGTIAALLGLALHPTPLSVRRLRAEWVRTDPAARRRFTAAAALSPLLLLAALTAFAHTAFGVLASALPAKAAGALIALFAAVISAVALFLVLGLSSVLGEQGTDRPVPVGVVFPASLLLAVLALAYGVVTGTESGGGGPLQIFGVLKREELDLRGVGLLLGIFAAAYLGPSVVSNARPLAVLAAAGFSASALAYSAFYGLSDPRVAMSLERGAPLGGPALSALRRATDRDGDGYSALFGGGDCDDADPRRNPGADDIPGNQIDEDCSGEDAVPVDLGGEAEPLPAGDPEIQQVPKDLNVVLITIDTLRYDLGYMGYPRPVSPNLDRLAARSAVFEHAYALASYTSKSLGPMLIGKYTSETHRGWAHFNRFGKEDTFVSERLQANGVVTLSAQGHYYFREQSGLGRGFDVEDHSAAPRVPQAEGDTTVNSDKITDAAIGLLSADNTKKQFYLWAHYLDPHAAYVPQPEFDFGRKGRDLYDGEVAFTDRHVGRLLDFIAASPFADRTAIIVTSDHGEAFGEHGMYRHGFELWEELVRVPLILYVPGVPPRRIASRRSLVDLVPTILDLTGFPHPSGEGTDFLSGRSLIPDISPREGQKPADRIVFVDMSAGPYNDERQAFIENDKKLIAANARPVGLYDLARDPLETENLLETDAAKIVVDRYKAFRRELRTVHVKPEKKK